MTDDRKEQYVSEQVRALVEQLARHHEVLITVEEGSTGGFSALVMHHLAHSGLLDHGLKLRPLVFPDRFIDHTSPGAQLAEAGLTARDIVATAVRAFGLSDLGGVVRHATSSGLCAVESDDVLFAPPEEHARSPLGRG